MDYYSNETVGVSSNGIDDLTNNLEECILGISMAFEEMDRIMTESSKYVKDDAYTSILGTYENISLYFSTIKSNLEVYKNDFITIKNNHEHFNANFQVGDVKEIVDEGGDYTGAR